MQAHAAQLPAQRHFLCRLRIVDAEGSGPPAWLDHQREGQLTAGEGGLRFCQRDEGQRRRHPDLLEEVPGGPFVKTEVDDGRGGNDGDGADREELVALTGKERQLQIVKREEEANVVFPTDRQQDVEIIRIGDSRDLKRPVRFLEGWRGKGGIAGEDLATPGQRLTEIVDQIVSAAGASQQDVDHGTSSMLKKDSCQKYR